MKKLRSEALFYTNKVDIVGAGSLSEYRFLEDDEKKKEGAKKDKTKQTDNIQVDTEFYVVHDVCKPLEDFDDKHFCNLFEDFEIL